MLRTSPGDQVAHRVAQHDRVPLRNRIGAAVLITVSVLHLLVAPAEAEVRFDAPSSGPVLSTATLLPSVDSTVSLPEGVSVGFLTVVYTGLGEVQLLPAGVRLQPQTPVGPVLNDGASGYDTHAALVAGVSTVEGDRYTLRVSYTTVQQLRPVGPAPWERAWLLFDYLDSRNYRYLILKHTGWELGRLIDGVQSFSATGSDRTFPVGVVDQVTVVRTKGLLSISVNGAPLVELSVSPISPVSLASAVYSEDAAVMVDTWTVANTVPVAVTPAPAAPPPGSVDPGGRQPAPAAPAQVTSVGAPTSSSAAA